MFSEDGNYDNEAEERNRDDLREAFENGRAEDQELLNSLIFKAAKDVKVIQRLENENSHYLDETNALSKMVDDAQEKITKLDKENKLMKEVMQFYSNEFNYTSGDAPGHIYIIADGGGGARHCLNEIENGDL